MGKTNKIDNITLNIHCLKEVVAWQISFFEGIKVSSFNMHTMHSVKLVGFTSKNMSNIFITK